MFRRKTVFIFKRFKLTLMRRGQNHARLTAMAKSVGKCADHRCTERGAGGRLGACAQLVEKHERAAATSRFATLSQDDVENVCNASRMRGERRKACGEALLVANVRQHIA